jgi:hypothetical protein
MDIVAIKQAVIVAVNVGIVAVMVAVTVALWRAGTRVKVANREKRAALDQQRVELDLLRARNAHAERVVTVMRVIAEDTALKRFPSDLYAAELAERTQQPIEVVFEALDACLSTVPSITRSYWFGRQ